jgi:glycosyltransferase involved in cell wall biosynthesis
MPSISTTVITFNEERNIERCLRSVAPFSDEIVVVDSESTDRTTDIARECGARVITNPWPGYGKQKQFALERASNPWVFSIDADEEVSPALCREIQTLDFSYDGYELPRRVRYMNRWIRHGVWYPGYVLRLFRRDKARFPDDVVHENVRVTGSIGRLRSDLLHYSYRDTDHHMEKIDQFSTLAAGRMFAQGKRAHFVHLAVIPFLEFLKAYVARLGFLDGRAGFVIARLHAVYVRRKYEKLSHLWLESGGNLRKDPGIRGRTGGDTEIRR